MARTILTAALILLCWTTNRNAAFTKRSIDLIAAVNKITAQKIPRHIYPISYNISIRPYPERNYFDATEKITIIFHEKTYQIMMLAHKDLKIKEVRVVQTVPDDKTSSKENFSRYNPPIPLKVINKEHRYEPFLSIFLDKPVEHGAQCEIELVFTGPINTGRSEGIFKTTYADPKTGDTKWFLGTHFRPDMASRVFPCFDEPYYKSSFIWNVAHKENMTVLSNMPLSAVRKETDVDGVWYWDTFQKTMNLPTFATGFVISDFDYEYLTLSEEDDRKSEIQISVWSRPDFLPALANVSDKVATALQIQEDFFGVELPLSKLDVVAVPNYQASKPVDSWGLLLFRESDLTSKGSWHIAQELAYQFIGAYATPHWWNDAHTNHALCRYVTAYTTQKMYNGLDTFNNWPMTTLYSIYYEFSKRYPHGKSTAIKQDSMATKTELVIRMLNYTLGEDTFKKAMRKFMADRKSATFFGDDLWRSITEAAWQDGTLDKSVRISSVVGSWITKDRLPLVNVSRNYEDGTATLSQRVYLRERPHDVPDKEQFLWWIPIVLIQGNELNFTNTRPIIWMTKKRGVHISGLPNKDTFIIVNPEEIGPFPVLYDVRNWNLLADFLQSENRTQIPVITRAKLLHDAWNLAYAGELSFATALNMTLFLAHERDYLAWDPVFTMIDHIGRHIDSSEVYKKFQTYVRLLLTPLYKELGEEPEEDESDGRAHLRSSSKVFLCQAGYAPCIEEAQEAFKKWMDSPDPDEGNPVANQYICTVFKWGSKEEWEFGLERVIRFPEHRKQNERTYLLKTLAGCPVDSWKIERLLNITVLEANGNFSDNDVYLIFSMLTGGANGYSTLFDFLYKNWDAIKARFHEKPSLWNSLLTSASTVFKTQEGLEKVTKLFNEKQGKFGTGEFIVQRAMKVIKEETKWSNENLPVIEAWLDDYLKNRDSL